MRSVARIASYRPAIVAATLAAIGLVVAAGIVLPSSSPASDEDGDATSPTPTVDGSLPAATTFPVPDSSAATSLDEAVSQLREVASVRSVLDAIAANDPDRMLGLFATELATCERRGAPADCAAVTGAQDGSYEAITIDEGTIEFPLSTKQARELLEMVLAAGPELSFASQYASGPLAGDHLLAFAITEVPLGPGGAQFLLEGVTLSGFGLHLNSDGGERPIVSIAPLTPGWEELEWAQGREPSTQTLIAPASLDRFTRIDAE